MGEKQSWRYLISSAICGFMSLLFATFFCLFLTLNPAAAQAPLPLETVFPGADRIGAFEGKPRAAAAWQNGEVVGYVFLTSDVVRSVGYSGKPIKTAVGLDRNGTITGAAVIEHHEPILVLGIDTSHLNDFVTSYAGLNVNQKVRVGKSSGSDRSADAVSVDGISGASVTSIVFNDSIMRAARTVARSRGILEDPDAQSPQLDIEQYEQKDWQALTASGAVSKLFLRNSEVDDGFLKQAGRDVPSITPRDPKGKFITLYAALLSPAGIGQNILGFARYSKLMAFLKPGEQPLLVAAQGLYSFKGWAWRKKNGVFDRFQLVQGQTTHRFVKGEHQIVEKLELKGSPHFREIGIFTIPANKGFDPTSPFRIELIVSRDTTNNEVVLASFPLSYKVPDRFVVQPKPAVASDDRLGTALGRAALVGDGVWLQVWENRFVEVIVLVVALLVLYLVLVFHNYFARNEKLLRTVRTGFLVFTVIGLGWLMSAQLSVVNVITFINALLTEFRWDFFLLDPIVFLLWCYVAVALLFWGRGVFCGWLCPFGALQELLARGARLLHIPQVPIPFGLSERVWPIKYIIFLGLLALSLHSVGLAEIGAEVEPFKTAISLKFLRAWPFVVYALGLLTVGLFVERFFCRYLCPLGASLAIPANNRMFDWLKRRPQCGTECHICATRCPVQAIHPDGRIDPHECIYCLDCQVLQNNDRVCPPAIARRKRREDRAARKAARASAKSQEQTGLPG